MPVAAVYVAVSPDGRSGRNVGMGTQVGQPILVDPRWGAPVRGVDRA